MAAASIHHTHQAPVTCGICERYEDVDFYCLQCKGNFCEACKVNHAQTPIYRNHKMIPILEGLKRQATVEECNTHLSSPYLMHCNDCHKLVCDECIATDHKGHVLDKIEDAIRKVRREINKYHKTLNTTYMSKCKSEEAKIKQNIAECKKFTLSLKSNINETRSELIKEVHRACDNMIKEAEDKEKHHISDMDKANHKLQDIAKEIELLMKKSKEATCMTKRASAQIKFNQEKPSLTHLTIPKAPKLHLPSFVPGKVNIGQIGEQIGTLLSRLDLRSSTEPLIDVSITHRQTFANKIQLVNVVCSYHAYVSGHYKEKELRLVDTEGNVLKCIKTEFDISNFAVTTSGDIIITDFDSRCIRIMTQTGQVTQTIKTNPNHPSGVCLGNNNQEIVVCVNTPDKSSSKLVVYSRDGKEIRTINYTDKPVGEVAAQSVTQNNRGDYCVVHWGERKVYVVDSNGALRYTYDGSGTGKEEEKFYPCNSCSDIYNHLFISDYNNHNIHMLDDEGKFLRFILTEQDGITEPTGLCIDKDGRLWVGQDTGGLCVVKYLK